MSSNAFDLQIPATEVQIAEAISVSDPDTADTIRRLAFERDRLITDFCELTRQFGEIKRRDEGLKTYNSVEPAHERRAGHSTLFVKEEVVNAFKTILAWCDRSGEEPEGQCLHEIEQVCRNALGLDLLRPVNVVPRVCCIVQTRDRMPEPHVLVIVSGGVAVWTGSVWLSKTGDDSGQVIRWEVTWWMSLPVDERADRREAALKQSYADLASSGGIVDAP